MDSLTRFLTSLCYLTRICCSLLYRIRKPGTSVSTAFNKFLEKIRGKKVIQLQLGSMRRADHSQDEPVTPPPPPTPAFCLVLTNLSLISEGAIAVSPNRRHLFVTPQEKRKNYCELIVESRFNASSDLCNSKNS